MGMWELYHLVCLYCVLLLLLSQLNRDCMICILALWAVVRFQDLLLTIGVHLTHEWTHTTQKPVNPRRQLRQMLSATRATFLA